MTSLKKILNKKSKNVIGLMSGTSMDGIDAGLINVRGYGNRTLIEEKAFLTFPYPDELKIHLIQVIRKKRVSLEEAARLNMLIGSIFAAAALKVCKKAKIPPGKIDLIGSHGQTLWHAPEIKEMFGYKTGASLQIGDPSVIAEKTGIVTVGDFRAADISAGGEGAPLIPYFDYLMFKDKKENRAVLNIGGISNITVLPKNCSKKDVTGFDCGPGNVLIDMAVKTLFNQDFDKNGKIASEGKVSDNVLSFLKKHPFILKTPPKSTGREKFSQNYLKKVITLSKKHNLKPEDIIRTITEFTALAVYMNYKTHIESKLKLDSVIISGGGIKNKVITNSLKQYFKGIHITSAKHYGISPDAKEAIAFAVFANEAVHGNPANIPAVTGAGKECILGKICL